MVDLKVVAIWNRLSQSQTIVLLDYGDRPQYNGNRQIAAALVRKDLAAWGPGGPQARTWSVIWTDLGRKVAQYGRSLQAR